MRLYTLLKEYYPQEFHRDIVRPMEFFIQGLLKAPPNVLRGSTHCVRLGYSSSDARTIACHYCKVQHYLARKGELAQGDARLESFNERLMEAVLLRFKDPDYRSEDGTINRIIDSLEYHR